MSLALLPRHLKLVPEVAGIDHHADPHPAIGEVFVPVGVGAEEHSADGIGEARVLAGGIVEGSG